MMQDATGRGRGSDDPSPGPAGRSAAASTTAGARPRGRPRDPEFDERITSAAASLMMERGFDKMTVDDVAELAGVGKATVYRRWSSKQELAVAAMEHLLKTEVPEADTANLAADLAQTYRLALAFANSPGGASMLQIAIVEAARDLRIAELYRAALAGREELTRQRLLRGIERGEVRPDADLDICSQWLTGLLTMRILTQRPLPPVEAADSLVDFVLRGVRAD